MSKEKNWGPGIESVDFVGETSVLKEEDDVENATEKQKEKSDRKISKEMLELGFELEKSKVMLEELKKELHKLSKFKGKKENGKKESIRNNIDTAKKNIDRLERKIKGENVRERFSDEDIVSESEEFPPVKKTGDAAENKNDSSQVTEKVTKDETETGFRYMPGMIGKEGAGIEVDEITEEESIEDQLKDIPNRKDAENYLDKVSKEIETAEPKTQEEIEKMNVEELAEEAKKISEYLKKIKEENETGYMNNEEFLEYTGYLSQIINEHERQMSETEPEPETLETEPTPEEESVPENVKETLEKLRDYAWSLQEELAEISRKNKGKLEDYNMGKEQSEEDKEIAEEVIKLKNMSETATLDRFGAEIATSSFEKDPEKRRKAAEAVSLDLDNLFKGMQIEILIQQKESNRRELQGEKGKVLRNFVNASGEKIRKAVSRDNNQQTGEPRKGWRGPLDYILKKISRNKAEETENDEEEFNEAEFKKAAAVEYLKIIEEGEWDTFFDLLKQREEEGMGGIIPKEANKEKIAKTLFEEYGDGKEVEDLMEIIEGFEFKKEDFEEARLKCEKKDGLNYEDYEIIVEPSGTLVPWNRKDGEPPVEKGKIVKKGFFDKPDEIIKKLLEQEKEMDILDVIFSEDEIDKVKNAKNIESLKKTVGDHLFEFDFHKDSNIATKYYHKLLFGLSNILSNYYESDKKKTDLDKLLELSIKLLVIDKDYNENANNYFATVLEKIEEFVKLGRADKKDELEIGKITEDMKEEMIKTRLLRSTGIGDYDKLRREIRREMALHNFMPIKLINLGGGDSVDKETRKICKEIDRIKKDPDSEEFRILKEITIEDILNAIKKDDEPVVSNKEKEIEEVTGNMKEEIRKKIKDIKKTDEDMFKRMEGFLSSFSDNKGLFGENFTKTQFDNFLKGSIGLDYDDIKDIKTRNIMKALRDVYEEVKNEKEGDEIKKDSSETEEKYSDFRKIVTDNIHSGRGRAANKAEKIADAIENNEEKLKIFIDM